jgi:hypothetical protein
MDENGSYRRKSHARKQLHPRRNIKAQQGLNQEMQMGMMQTTHKALAKEKTNPKPQTRLQTRMQKQQQVDRENTRG